MRRRVSCVLLALVIASLACNMPSPPSTTPTGSAALLTEVAGTLGVIQTATGTQPGPTQTPDPGVPATSTPTLSRPVDTNTPTTQPCDQAQFIADVTIPDGTRMVSGQAFTKTWRLRNLGSCTWDNRYALVFSGGDALGAPAVINLPGSVPSGATVDLSIDMKAPAATGTYVSRWKLRNPAGVVFGVVSDQPFFVEIVVVQATGTVTPTLTPTITGTPTATQPSSGLIYSFAANLCQAEWRSQAGGSPLPCPGTSGGGSGYVMQLQNPVLETGAVETAPVVLTVPRQSDPMVITGRFPAITIRSGDFFRARLGCISGQEGCSVIYQLNYSVGGGEPANLGEWVEDYNGSMTPINVDLSALNGQTVQLILVVLAGDDAAEDQAVWVNPRIVRE